jgi:TrmH family RNA methyltransferase
VTAPPIIVLVEPQDIVNIASTVRIAKNFALPLVRLVNPGVFDPYRIEGIAHHTADVVERIGRFDALDQAIADCVFVLALTARERTAKRRMLRPRAAAVELAARSAEGPVAMVFGREDKGLTNRELDRCHALATIATNPGHRSLNLAQAVAIMAYECWVAREGLDAPRKPPRRAARRAAAADLDRLFHDWRRTLAAVEFFKTRNAENVMRSLRELFFRADPDSREGKLLRAIALEVVHFLQRRGVPIDLPPELVRPGGVGAPRHRPRGGAAPA